MPAYWVVSDGWPTVTAGKEAPNMIDTPLRHYLRGLPTESLTVTRGNRDTQGSLRKPNGTFFHLVYALTGGLPDAIFGSMHIDMVSQHLRVTTACRESAHQSHCPWSTGQHRSIIIPTLITSISDFRGESSLVSSRCAPGAAVKPSDEPLRKGETAKTPLTGPSRVRATDRPTMQGSSELD